MMTSLAYQTQFIIKSPKDVKSILLHAQVNKFMIETIKNVFVQLTNIRYLLFDDRLVKSKYFWVGIPLGYPSNLMIHKLTKCFQDILIHLFSWLLMSSTIYPYTEI